MAILSDPSRSKFHLVSEARSGYHCLAEIRSEATHERLNRYEALHLV